jgi:hypothetical protein
VACTVANMVWGRLSRSLSGLFCASSRSATLHRKAVSPKAPPQATRYGAATSDAQASCMHQSPHPEGDRPSLTPKILPLLASLPSSCLSCARAWHAQHGFRPAGLASKRRTCRGARPWSRPSCTRTALQCCTTHPATHRTLRLSARGREQQQPHLTRTAHCARHHTRPAIPHCTAARGVQMQRQ